MYKIIKYKYMYIKYKIQLPIYLFYYNYINIITFHKFLTYRNKHIMEILRT